jgi:hypothetical protein
MELPIFLYFDKQVLEEDITGKEFVRVVSEVKVCKIDIEPESIVAVSDFGTPAEDFEESKRIRYSRVYLVGGHKIDIALPRREMRALWRSELNKVRAESLLIRNS